jgi:hypothetical protein
VCGSGGIGDNMPPDPHTIAVESMLPRFCYARKQHVFVNIETAELLTPTAFDTVNIYVAPCGATGPRSAHNQFLNNPKADKHAGLTYRPGEPLIVDDEINTWRPSKLVPIAGDASPWLNHVAELIPDEAQRNHFIDWCAYVLQRPGKKIGHAILLYTEAHGAGKDTALAPLKAGVGEHNYKITSPAALCGTFTTFLGSQVIYVPEMKNYTKGEVYNNLKMRLSRPPDTVSVRKMWMDAFEIPNTQNWIFTTNSGAAIGFESGDRRLWVPNCVGHPKEDEPYYLKVWHWLKKERGLQIAVGYLLKRDISRLRPGDAPLTTAKQDMIAQSRHPAQRWECEQFDEGGQFEDRTIVGIGEILAVAAHARNIPRDVNLKHVAAALKALGFCNEPEIRVRMGKGFPRLWSFARPACWHN